MGSGRRAGMWVGVAIVLLFSSCSVVSENIREEAAKGVTFSELTRDTEAYVGKTVILGGEILAVQNRPGSTLITVLQIPLGYRERPESKDRSKGRFLVVREGFLDPEVFEKGREITVAGTVLGKEKVKVDDLFLSLLKIGAREIHLWSEERDERPYYPYYYDPFYWPPPYYGPRPGLWGPYRY